MPLSRSHAYSRFLPCRTATWLEQAGAVSPQPPHADPELELVPPGSQGGVESEHGRGGQGDPVDSRSQTEEEAGVGGWGNGGPQFPIQQQLHSRR